MKRRIMFSDLQQHDQRHKTSLIRELEMAVDAIVTFNPGYCAQFFTDCRLYGIDEAKVYLIRFVEKNYQSPDDLAHEIVILSKRIERIHEYFGTGVRGSEIRN